MNFKKIATLIVILGLSGAFLAACGSKNNQKTETLEGKSIEVTEYTMPDGNIVQIPVENEEGAETEDSSAE